MPIIYKIVCRSNSKIYVGSTSTKFRRWNNHKSDLRKNRHHCINLQNSWNKYGEENFYFEIIEETNIENYRDREQYWIDCYLREDSKKLFNSAKEVLPGSKTYSYISEEDAKNIIKDCEKGLIRKNIAKKYNITPQSVSDIAFGRSWGYLKRNKMRWHPSHILSDEDVENIKNYYKGGLSQGKISKIFKVNQSTISRIISKLRRKEIKYAL